jgi:hypothetical protein
MADALTIKKRGIFLYVMIAIVVLGTLLGIWSLFSLQLPTYYTLWIAFSLLLNAIAIYGLYTWKKWGLYIDAASCVISIVEHLVFSGWGSDILISPVIFVLLWWAYYRKRASFN